ncbi:helix-turn-helix domain-containing protein [Sutcliffiella cohnii]
MDIGRKIKFFRKEKSISQSTLAHELCSVSYLSKIENNLVIPNVELIENLFNRLQITSFNMFDTQTLLSQLKNWNYNILQQDESAAKKNIY